MFNTKALKYAAYVVGTLNYYCFLLCLLGFQVPSLVNGSSTIKSDSTNNNTGSLKAQHSTAGQQQPPGGYCGEISVPVYATVKGVRND